jgi:Host cell surface-exposed lipoprotein
MLNGRPGAATSATVSTALAPAVIPESVSRDNAKEMARSYLDYAAFSRTGLIEQLEYEGFSKADATYGADATRTNWFKQAARMAADYLDYQAFSRRGLIAQLKYEGFTSAQATYGAKSVGL